MKIDNSANLRLAPGAPSQRNGLKHSPIPVERDGSPKLEKPDRVEISGAAAPSKETFKSLLGNLWSTIPQTPLIGLGPLAPVLGKVLLKVGRFFYHPKLDSGTKETLLEQARDPRKEHLHWRTGAELKEAKNAHYTNTSEQMSDSLQGEYNFLEGDVHLGWGVRKIPVLNLLRSAIMAHHPHELGGMRLKEWLEVGEASGRGIKIDIKQAAAIPKIIRHVKKRGIPDHRLIFNLDVIQGPHSYPRMIFPAADLLTGRTAKLRHLKKIRRAFPEATIALGAVTGPQPKGTMYSDKQLAEFQDWAKKLGGPITFPLRAEFVDKRATEALAPFGSVSVWNDPKTFDPTDIPAEEQRLRDLGVDGKIDLRGSSDS